MYLHDLAFYSALFFIIGVFIVSIIHNLIFAIFAIVFLLVILYFYGSSSTWLRDYSVLIAATFLFFGAAYYFLHDHYQKSPNLIFDKPLEITATIDKVRTGEKSQEIIIENIKIYTQKYPEYFYGDKISIEGIIEKPDAPFSNYLFKDGIVGVMRYPKITLQEKDAGNKVLTALYNIKNHSINIFKSVLPYERAQFLAGITLGEKTNFSENFKKELSQSGTSHLVALSGYNVTILAEMIALIFLFTIGHRPLLVFPLSLLTIFLFVLMTGAEASIVRAAIMGGIMLLANHAGRLYNFRNSITIVAALMIMLNPKILVFDIGFQLSFAALLGIVYIRPLIIKLFKIDFESDVLEWKKNLTTTFSAQLAVFPILLTNFGSASLSGLLANVLILMLVPYTMLLGFLMAIFGYFSNIIAIIIGQVANIFLTYELFIIRFFSQFGYIENFKIGSWFIAVYYILLISIFYYFNKIVPERSREAS